jgi:hypothetical protein
MLNSLVNIIIFCSLYYNINVFDLLNINNPFVRGLLFGLFMINVIYFIGKIVLKCTLLYNNDYSEYDKEN